jgi:hypothetical protein
MSKRHLSVLAILAATIGCEGTGWEEPEGAAAADPPVDTVQQKLFFDKSVKPWPGGTVPVCFHPDTAARPDFPTYSKYVMNWARYSWPTVANVTFTGFGVCSRPNVGPGAQVIIRDDQDGGSAIGFGAPDVYLVTQSLYAPGMTSHEFGHVLGFLHEMQRSDFPAGTSRCADADKVAGDVLGTPPDRQSIMTWSYCPESDAGELSTWDAVGVRKKYGTRVGSFVPVTTYGASTGTEFDTVALSAPAYTIPKSASGWLFAKQLPGTIPLKRYTRNGRLRTVANPTSETELKNAGYTLVSTDGYIFPTSTVLGGTIALYQWKSTNGLNQAIYQTNTRSPGSGWQVLRQEGWVFTERPYDLLWLLWYNNVTDNQTANQNATFLKGQPNPNDPNGVTNSWEYLFVGYDSAVLRWQAPGTVPLKTFYSVERGDHFTTATKAGEDSALAAGYKFIRIDGFVYPTSQPGLVPLKSYWSGSSADNMTTASIPRPSGYIDVRTEGYVFPL